MSYLLEKRNLLNDEDLEKLNSTNGIISLLCDIPNYNEDMYQELSFEQQEIIKHNINIKLVSQNQINSNLNLSLKNRDLAFIEEEKLYALALYYFGIKDNGKYIGYICPYSGKYFDLKSINIALKKRKKDKNNDERLELEHIKPRFSHGGTILSNCIPASVEANSIGEKGSLHLLDWYEQSGKKYYSQTRLYNLVNYILSAYSIEFKEFKRSDYIYDYNFNNLDENIIINDKKYNKIIKNTKKNKLGNYYTYLNSLINKLDKDGCDTLEIRNKIEELKNNKIFDSVDNFEFVQNVVEKLFFSYCKSSHLTYTLNVNYVKLVESLNLDNCFIDKETYIENKLLKRLILIDSIISEDKKTMNDYLISLKEIQDFDLLYIESPTKEDIIKFKNNIRIGYETKLELFIEMCAKEEYTLYENGMANDNNIFKNCNEVPFIGFDKNSGLIANKFWNIYKNQIIERLNFIINKYQKNEILSPEEQKEYEKYKKAKKAIDQYYIINKHNKNKRIELFIEMLSQKKYTSYENGKPDSYNIFCEDNDIYLINCENIDLKTNSIWQTSKSKIINIIENNINLYKHKQVLSKDEEQEYEKYKKAKKAIDIYEFYNPRNLLKKQNLFIKMMSEDKYTSYKNGKPDEFNIFYKENKVLFEGYEEINGLYTNNMWLIKYREDIIDQIKNNINFLLNKEILSKEEQQDLEMYKKALKNAEINKFYSPNNIKDKAECFIKMLGDDKYTSYKDGKPDKLNILSYNNRVLFEKYERIDGLYANNFYHSGNNNEYIDKLIEDKINILTYKQNKNEFDLLELENMKNIQKKLNNYKFSVSNERKIEVFIEMLSNDIYTPYKGSIATRDNIFNQENKVLFEGYNIPINQFWNNNSSNIKKKITNKINGLLNKELSKEDKVTLEIYKKAKYRIDEYELSNNIDAKIDLFIKMLGNKKYLQYNNTNPTQTNLFNQKCSISFEGYPRLLINGFWSDNPKIKDRINERLQKINKKEIITEEDKKEKNLLKEVEQNIKNHEFAKNTNIMEKVTIYINMLCNKKYTSNDNNNILANSNNVPFEGYPLFTLNSFWNRNSRDYIIPLLFFNYIYDRKSDSFQKSPIDYSEAKYDAARNAILNYFKVDNIETYLEQRIIKAKLTEKIYKLYELNLILKAKKERVQKTVLSLEQENEMLNKKLRKVSR